ncbi:transglutaminase family protein [Nocardia callitridis]|uniref:Transglutaminase family protein n=1 Tax=Nocardia callitridis TaxID=648753 RepID=A0ABP9JYB3_9NOCA
MSGEVEFSGRYRIRHVTTYAYSDEVGGSYGRAYLTPRTLPRQRVLGHELRIDPQPSDRSVGPDVYGNTTAYFQVSAAHDQLVVTGESLVEVAAPDPTVLELAGQPWEQMRPTTNPLAVEFTLDLQPAEITEEVTAYAAESFTPSRPLREAVAELFHRVHTDFGYRSGSTTVATKVADVFAARTGVCQDFARIGVACLRSHGLAARYVSGYLATDPPPGGRRVVGADATHAWSAVWIPSTEPGTGHWLDFDPTNNQFADTRYITLAWGRDYTDVPPLRGIIYTDAAQSTITVSVDVIPA